MINKWRLVWIVLGWIVTVLPSLAYAASLKITSIQVPHTDSSIQIIIKSSAPSQPHIFTLAHPDRLVFDFPNAQLAMKLKSLNFADSAIKDVRSGAPVPNVLRLVFDINSSFHFKTITPLPTQRMVVTLAVSTKNVEKPKFAEKKQALPAIKHAIVAKSEAQATTDNHIFIVVIDPGHGGKDTGAIGPSGTQEKDVVLKIATQLADLINRTPNMRAVMTRHGNYYVTLHNRLVYARKNKADIYISIHADAFLNNWASGASVYALSKNGATSIAARWLAKRDNYSELGGVTFNSLEDQSPVLRSVLIDLAQTATDTDSMRLGAALLDEIDNVTMLHYPRVEQAPFMVLKSPDIPSVLVETGFISNPKEELRLSDTKYQQKMAVSLFNGIRNYQKKYAAAGV